MGCFIDKRTESKKMPSSGGVPLETLDAMDAVDLANDLERLLDSMTDVTYEAELITAYLDALDRKAPMPEFPDAKTAFEKFQKMVPKQIAL